MKTQYIGFWRIKQTFDLPTILRMLPQKYRCKALNWISPVYCGMQICVTTTDIGSISSSTARINGILYPTLLMVKKKRSIC